MKIYVWNYLILRSFRCADSTAQWSPQLEYRGYDSAGIALFDENSKIHFIKKVGKVAALRKVCEEDPIVSHCGISHTAGRPAAA